MFAADYTHSLHGYDASGRLGDDEWCRIVRDFPHGSTHGPDTFVGDWAEVEVYPENDRFIVPRSHLHTR
jgi:hypothetical protein